MSSQILQSDTTCDTRGPQRERLPDTRRSITHKFEIGGQEGHITVGLYDDGRPGEVFLAIGKEGSTLGGLVDCVGILTSVALQYGVPLEPLVHKFSYCRFEPSGWTRNPEIRQATSIVDYVFRWLGTQFTSCQETEKEASHA
jgi:ribonucleoside-diphosphate reductase alpha chain